MLDLKDATEGAAHRNRTASCSSGADAAGRCTSRGSHPADLSILNNGTVTFVRTPERLLGVTAGHVLQGYLDDAAREQVTLQLFDAVI